MSLIYPPSLSSPTSPEDQISTLKLLNNIGTVLSLVGIFYFFYLYHKLQSKTFITKLVFHLMFSDLFYSIVNFLANFDKNPYICTIEGFAREYTQLTTLFWAVALAFSAYVPAVHNRTNLPEKYWIMKLVGYGVPLVISLVPFIPSLSFEYGQMGAYCWISNKNPETRNLPKWMTLLMIRGWICLSIILTTYWYIRVYLVVRSFQCKGVSARKLFMYPLILLISFFPVIIESLFEDTRWDYQVSIFHMITQHSNGFLNAITYGLQTTQPILKVQKRSSEEKTVVKSEEKVREKSLNYTESVIGFESVCESEIRKELLRAENDV